MIQLLALRPFKTRDGKTSQKTEVINTKWLAPSVASLFENIKEYIDDIPEHQRWNVYYTVLDCANAEKEHRVFESQKIIPFDIDKIDELKIGQYIDIFFKVTGLTQEKTATVFSGNGLQFLVELEQPFTDVKYFNENRVYYKALTSKIQNEMSARGLPGNIDDSVWSSARLMRLPNTINRKPHGDKHAALVEYFPDGPCKLSPQPFSLKAASGLPDVPKENQIDKETFKKYVVDSQAVLSGCDFIKWAQTNPNEVTEPLWYGLLSITSRLDDGVNISHKLSEGHAKYSHAETEQKIEQAQQASGPRTCQDINSRWGKCAGCPHYQKITSPILIRGEDFIPTEKQGFHEIVITRQGPKFVPNFDDLMRFFDRAKQFKCIPGAQIVYTFNGKFYEICHDNQLYSFAEEHFNPKPKHQTRVEFRNKVLSNNIVSPDFFTNNQNKINFQNGVLDLKTMAIEPHSPNYGFRYALPYDYNPEATAPLFKKFLNEVTGNDETLQNLLLEFGGYALSGDDCWAQKALILSGAGKNGKSVFLKILESVAGKENIAGLNLSQVKNDNNRQLLEGKLFNISEETPSHALQESSLFKQMVTGGTITVKLMYKQPYFINNTCKLIFACNELPESKDATYGLTRRMLIVPFKQVFEGAKEDKFIAKKLMDELPGIFNLFLEGYQRLVKNGRFTQSKATTDALQDYKLDIDPILDWKESGDYIKVHPLNGKCHKVTYKELYQSARQFLEIDNGNRRFNTPSYRKFCKKLHDLIPDLETRVEVGWDKDSRKTTKVIYDIELLQKD